MTDRDELAKVVHDSFDALDDPKETRSTTDVITDAILAAGYRKPRTIETHKQLKDEHAGLVVIDGNGMVWKIDGKYDHWINIEEGDSTLYGDEDIPLPVTVLHEAVTE